MRFGAIKIGIHFRDKHGDLFGAIKIGTHFRDRYGHLFL